ncbi:malonate transporter subunit MadM [Alkalihalophilus pseudofirmus]|uniref:Malonate transporter subunit MadM n=1 Tax=Alkalihalophilus pseudofirmus TaxID=79885 RepID=A0AAJ2KUP0_ALKPS|nr:malonate transporter subunit MadM [Alkalihalophilus pseudofirmus]MDV2883591.1 malonate transporter subunit MadM [Alkalihalophilus pseudofirmus]OLS36551.1 malonate transporter subunit MadM [Alkalihalophilus pseudofirmus]
MDAIISVLEKNGLVTAFAVIGMLMYVSYVISKKLTRGRVHGSAIAIILGLVLAYFGGITTGGDKGLADLSIFAGIGIMGGAMLRDLAIIATAFGVHLEEVKKAGLSGILSLFVGIASSFLIGVLIALAFGYTDAASLATIGAGTTTYIVGPVTGAAVGASSEVIALSIAAGLIKAILIMIATPFIAKYIGLNNPRSAIVYGGLMGSTSGVAGGLAATDPKLVPYGAMTATFYTGLGCLLAPSILFLAVRAVFGA